MSLIPNSTLYPSYIDLHSPLDADDLIDVAVKKINKPNITIDTKCAFRGDLVCFNDSNIKQAINLLDWYASKKTDEDKAKHLAIQDRIIEVEKDYALKHRNYHNQPTDEKYQQDIRLADHLIKRLGIDQHLKN